MTSLSGYGADDAPPVKFNSLTFKVRHVVGKMLTYAAIGGGVGGIGLGAATGMFEHTVVGSGGAAVGGWGFNPAAWFAGHNLLMHGGKDLAAPILGAGQVGLGIGAAAGAVAGLVHGLNTMTEAEQDKRDEFREIAAREQMSQQRKLGLAQNLEQWKQAMQQQNMGLPANMTPGLPMGKHRDVTGMGRMS